MCFTRNMWLSHHVAVGVPAGRSVSRLLSTQSVMRFGRLPSSSEVSEFALKSRTCEWRQHGKPRETSYTIHTLNFFRGKNWQRKANNRVQLNFPPSLPGRCLAHINMPKAGGPQASSSVPCFSCSPFTPGQDPPDIGILGEGGGVLPLLHIKLHLSGMPLTWRRGHAATSTHWVS